MRGTRGSLAGTAVPTSVELMVSVSFPGESNSESPEDVGDNVD